jgi:hypothetical protein
MDEREALTDIDAELRRELSLELPAAFVDRTRAHVLASRQPSPAVPRWPAALPAIAAMLIAAIWVIGDLAPPDRQSPAALAMPLASRQMPNLDVPAPSGAPGVRVVSGPDDCPSPPAPQLMPAREPEVLVSAAERRGFNVLIAALAEQRLDPSSIADATASPPESIELSALIQPEPLHVSPLVPAQ